MKNDFTLAFNEIVEMRALPREVVLEALSQALVSAYRRDENISSNQRVEAVVDVTGGWKIFLEKEVVESVESVQTEVTLEVARRFEPNAQLGDTVMVEVETAASFGRIAAQTAKQVILQRIREAERETLYDEFVEREGDLVTGTVQSVTSGSITISLGRAEAVMPRAQQIPGERYRHHDKVRVYVVEVKKNSRAAGDRRLWSAGRTKICCAACSNMKCRRFTTVRSRSRASHVKQDTARRWLSPRCKKG
jgi:N utilization substance protein A